MRKTFNEIKEIASDFGTWIAIIVFAAVLVTIPLSACRHRSKPPHGGGGTPPPPPPPKEERVTLQQLKERQRTLANAAVLHPLDKGGARVAVEMAKGAAPYLPPLDYWYGDIGLRVWGAAKDRNDAALVAQCENWFRQWVKLRNTDWATNPQGSMNHQFASTTGLYAAYLVLGPDGYRAAGGRDNPKELMNNLLRGEWTCCGTERCVPEGIGCNPPYYGEAIGSRHYQQRTTSDLTAIADVGLEDESKLAREALDRIVAFLNGKVREDGIWPWPLIPFVRPGRDGSTCYPWPDAEIWRRYKEVTGDHHPENTPYSSYILLDYVKLNPDFIGHYLRGACDERSEMNDIGYLLAGQSFQGREGWRPKKTGR